MYIWGAQLEELPFASSYIPTTTTAVTRSYDECSLSLDNAIGVTNDFSLSADTTLNRVLSEDGHSSIFSMDGTDGTDRDRLLLFRNHNDGLDVVYPFGLSSVNNGIINDSIAGSQRTLLTKDDSNIIQYGDGIQNSIRIVDATQIINGVTYLTIGNWNSGSHLNGHVKNVRIWGLALTAQEAKLA